VYLPLSRLLTLHVQETGRLYRAYRRFMEAQDERTPFVIGVVGSVSVGKSTTARLLALLLARWPQHPRVELVPTDGFLWPNAELERRGLMARKGFPESYDRRGLLRFVTEVKAGRSQVAAPVYSHLTYDIVPGAQVVIHRPDVLIIEGLNVLQPAPPGRPGGERLHRLLRVRRRGGRRHRRLVRGAVPAVAGDGVPGPELVLPPVRGDGRGTAATRRRNRSGRRSTGRPRSRTSADAGRRPWCCARGRHQVTPGAAAERCDRGWHAMAGDGASGRDTGDIGDTGVIEETELAARLRLVVGRLNRRIRIDGRESVPPLQLSAMVTVEEHGPLRLSELARREAVSVPTMSRVLTALDEQGLVVRTPDPQDARGVLVTLSDDGERRLAEVRSHRTALVARRLGRLDTVQRASLAAALPALEALLEDE
jgi:DNA-binding MarR family transcriptional regulator